MPRQPRLPTSRQGCSKFRHHEHPDTIATHYFHNATPETHYVPSLLFQSISKSFPISLPMATPTNRVLEPEVSPLEIRRTPITNESYEGARCWICRLSGGRDKNSPPKTRRTFWRDELESCRHTRGSGQSQGLQGACESAR